MAVILVSACLLGCSCRYKGDHCENKEILALGREHTLVGVCPEQLGGLSTPRAPSEIQGERVINRVGEDVSGNYRRGAEEALRLAKISGASIAILKAKSPACGKGRIYDGSFRGTMTDGNGIAARLLSENGIPIFTEDELPLAIAFLSGESATGK